MANRFASLSDQSGTSRSRLEASNKEAEFLSLRQLAKDAKVQISNTPLEIEDWPSRLSLFAISNQRGYFAAATNTGFILAPLYALRQAFTSSSPFTPQYSTSLPSKVAFIKFLCNGVRFVVCTRAGHVLVYDTPQNPQDWASQPSATPPNISPLHSFPESQDPIVDVLPNPSDQPALVAILRSTGNGASRIELLDVQTFQLIGNIQGDSGPSRQTAMAWSPKGKQLVVGDTSGQLVQYTPDGSRKSGISQPDGFDSPQEISSIAWLENTVFFVVYRNAQGHDYQPYIIIHDPKASSTIDVSIEDPSPPWGLQERLSARFYCHLKSWEPTKHLLFVGDAPADEIGVVACFNLGDSTVPWSKLDLEDTARATLPLTSDGASSCILGMELDLTSTATISTSTQFGDDAPSLPPAPILFAYTNEGYIIGYHVMNSTEPSYPGMAPTSTSASLDNANRPSTPPRTSAPLSNFATTTPTQSPFAVSTPQAKFGQTAFGSTTPAPVFGQTSFGTSTPVGSPTSTQGFGQNGFASMALPSAPTSVFGQSGFGSIPTVTFGQSGFAKTATTQPLVGFGSSASASGFGSSSSNNQTQTAASVFGKPSLPAAPVFGQNAFGSSTGSGFGQSGFGATTTQPTGFGPTSSLGSGKGFGGFAGGSSVGFASFGSTGSNVFGAPASTTPSTSPTKLLEAKAEDSMEAHPQTPGVTSTFAVTQPKPGGAFGTEENKNQFSTFGQSSSFNQPTTTSFGSTNTKPVAPVFGATGFGSTPATTLPTFGSSTALGSSTKTQPTFGSSSFGAPGVFGGFAPKPPPTVTAPPAGGGFAFAAKSGFSGFSASSSSGSFGDMLSGGGDSTSLKPASVVVFGQKSTGPDASKTSGFSFGSRSGGTVAARDEDEDDNDDDDKKSRSRFPEEEMEAREPTMVADPKAPGIFGNYIPNKPASSTMRTPSPSPAVTPAAPTFGFGGLSFGGDSTKLAVPSTTPPTVNPIFGIPASGQASRARTPPAPQLATTKPTPPVEAPISPTKETASGDEEEGDQEEDDQDQADDGEEEEEEDDNEEDGEDDQFVISATDEEDDEAEAGNTLNDSAYILPKPPTFASTSASSTPKASDSHKVKPTSNTPSGYNSEDEASGEGEGSTTPPGTPQPGKAEPSRRPPSSTSVSSTPPGAPQTLTPSFSTHGGLGIGKPPTIAGRSSAFSSIPSKSSPLASPPISLDADSSPEKPKPIPAPMFGGPAPSKATNADSEDDGHDGDESENSPVKPNLIGRRTPTQRGVAMTVPLPSDDKEPSIKRPKTPPMSSLGLGFGASKPKTSLNPDTFSFGPAPPVPGPSLVPPKAGTFAFGPQQPKVPSPPPDNAKSKDQAPAKSPTPSLFGIPAPSLQPAPAMPLKAPAPLLAPSPIAFKAPQPPPTPPPSKMEVEFSRVIAMTEGELYKVKEQVFRFAQGQSVLWRSQVSQHPPTKLSYEDLSEPSKWGLADLKTLRRLQLTLEDDVIRIKDQHLQVRKEISDLESYTLKAETSKEEIGRYIRARSDPEFAKLVKVRHLGPEHAENQQRLRKIMQLVSDRVQQLEDIIAEAKRKVDQAKVGKTSLPTPTLEIINRSLTRIQRGSQGRVDELDRLIERIAALSMESLSPPSPDFDLPPVNASLERSGSASTLRSTVPSVGVRQEAAAALNAERAGLRLKDALLSVRNAPILNQGVVDIPNSSLGGPSIKPTLFANPRNRQPGTVQGHSGRIVHEGAPVRRPLADNPHPPSHPTDSPSRAGQEMSSNTGDIPRHRSIFDSLNDKTGKPGPSLPPLPHRVPVKKVANNGAGHPVAARRGYGLTHDDITGEDEDGWIHAEFG